MKENQTTTTEIQSSSDSVVASAAVPANDKQPKTNEIQLRYSFPVIILSILLVISVAIAGFFAFQTQNLSAELIKIKAGVSPVASTVPDTTANWKTYTNSKYNYSLQYPQELELSENCTVIAMGTHLTCVKSSDFGVLLNERDGDRFNNSMNNKKGFALLIDLVIPEYGYDIYMLQKEYKQNYTNVELLTTDKTPILKVLSNNDAGNVVWLMINNNNVYRVTSPFNTQKYPVIDQIISTFKFIN